MAIAIPIPLSVRMHGGVEKSFGGEYDLVGARGQSLAIEEFRVDRLPLPHINISYNAHIQDIGIVAPVHQDEWIGFPGKSLTAFSASLEGPGAPNIKEHDFATIGLSSLSSFYLLAISLRLALNKFSVERARANYINLLGLMLHQHGQFNEKLALLKSSSESANKTLLDVNQSLESHLKAFNVSSTDDSAVSIIGKRLLFTPAFLIGVALAGAGVTTSVVTTFTQAYLFEDDASKAFGQAIGIYTSSSNALQVLFAKIEATKEFLIEALTIFHAALDNLPSNTPTATPSAHPSLPAAGGQGGPPGPGVHVPEGHHVPNGFSKITLKELADSTAGVKPLTNVGIKPASEFGEILGKNAGRLVVKALPKLAKAVPILSVAIDIAFIATSWKNDNETLRQTEKLRLAILEGFQVSQNAVKQYDSVMADLAGSEPLRKSLGKLIKLRKINPGPPCSPEEACNNMFELMRELVNIPLLLFVNQQGKDHDDETKNTYETELLPQADVIQLSEISTTAPVVDSVYERYPDIYDSIDDKQPMPQPGEQQQVSMMPAVGSSVFRAKCEWVPFGDQVVYNVSGSSADKRVGSWVRYWKWWFFYVMEKGAYLDRRCCIFKGPHSDYFVGGLVEKDVPDTELAWYILPVCQKHNAPSGTYDRGHYGGRLLTLKPSYAVKIPPK
ncbi:MAG: hypothetical protein M1829_000954 [Trizodia sp. TS-e1964]|nr:MAG: hypothetical protein M1829_000954 [Trizodia sp. TS-e1964]